MSDKEFGGDLVGAEFWGADLTGATFRDVNLTDATISHAWLVNVDIDALVDRLVINGVDVTDFVNDNDPWFPLRAMLRPTDPAAMTATWSTLEHEWDVTIERARELGDDAAHGSVGGEFSFVQTLRHLVFAMDRWYTVPITGQGFHPTGLPNTGSLDFPWPGLERDASPSLAEALGVRTDRSTEFHDFLLRLDPAELTCSVEILENGANPLLECIHTVFDEEFWHLRYARRDLAVLEAPPAP